MFRVRNWTGEEINSGTEQREKKPSGECHPRRRGDAAGVPALKEEFKSGPTGRTGGGTIGAHVNQPKWDKRGEIVSMFVAT